MSKLSSTLRGLLKRSADTCQPVAKELGKGLHVRATADFPRRLCLWRTEGEWGPSEASEREGHVCAKALGWGTARLYWHGKYLVVEEGAVLL